MNFKELSRKERTEYLASLGEPAYREKQIFKGIFRGAESPAELSDIPVALKNAISWENLKTVLCRVSSDGTRKYLFELPDGNRIETVLMKYSYGHTLCVSTEVGCNMGCLFCASALGGKVRNLKAWEIADQYIAAARASGEIISRVVLMGMGEPLDNYGETAEFLRQIHEPCGIGMSYRNITLSTSGLIPEIERFGDEFPQVNLAVSLHSALQEKRESLMPIARRYPLKDLIPVCKRHAEKTGRRVTFEYALIEGKNDAPSDADALARLLSGLLCHVNLISLNPGSGAGLKGTGKKAVLSFAERLTRRGIPTTVRRRLGDDIEAACGQLRAKAATLSAGKPL